MCLGDGGWGGGGGGDEQIRHPQGGRGSRILGEIRQGGEGVQKTLFSRGRLKCMVPMKNNTFQLLFIRSKFSFLYVNV